MLFGHIQRIFRFAYLTSLTFGLAALLSGAGCSKRISFREPVLEKTWTCDKAADDATKRHDYEAAIILHHSFLEKKPGNGLALYHLGYAYGQTGNHMKEVFYYEKAIALGLKEDGIFFNLGMASVELDKIEKSIRAFKKALDINPDSADSHFGLATAYRMDLDYNLAVEEFLKAIKIDPEHLEARLYLSVLYTDMGELQKAAEQLRKILNVDPTNARARKFLEKIEKE